MTPVLLDPPDVKLIKGEVYRDQRGLFSTTYLEEEFTAMGIPAKFRQESYSTSCRGTIRGLHFQNPHAQGKLLTVLTGRIWDVVLDIRKTSATFGQWASVDLAANAGQTLWIPPGFAHGFQAVSEEDAIVYYKLTDARHQASEGIVRWDDVDLAIGWPIDSPILSERDAEAPCLKDISNLPEN
jgi:dTDP-4-dehydrorhamnose 3,5-epimerase